MLQCFTRPLKWMMEYLSTGAEVVQWFVPQQQASLAPCVRAGFAAAMRRLRRLCCSSAAAASAAAGGSGAEVVSSQSVQK